MLGRRVMNFPEKKQHYTSLPLWVVNISGHKSCELMIHYLLFLDLSYGVSEWITFTTWSQKPSISQSTYLRAFLSFFFFFLFNHNKLSTLSLLFLVVWQFYSRILVFLSLVSLLTMQTYKEYWKHGLFIACSFSNLCFVTITAFSNTRKL